MTNKALKDFAVEAKVGARRRKTKKAFNLVKDKYKIPKKKKSRRAPLKRVQIGLKAGALADMYFGK